MKLERYSHTVTSEEAGARLDMALAVAFPQFTRSFIRRLLDDGQIEVDGRKQKAGYRVKNGQNVCLTVPTVPDETEAEEISLDIMFEDSHLVVINKPAGLVVHPAAGNRTGTLVNALLYHVEDLSGIGGVERPGIVHRLDKDTSGLLVVAKNDQAHLALSRQLSQRLMQREYVAVAHGRFKEVSGTVDAPIARHRVKRKEMAVVAGGRVAVTHFEVLEQYMHYAYISLRLKTGRTHQIRVHMTHIGHSLLGDQTYGIRKSSFSVTRQMLHARKLGFTHPVTGEGMEFSADPPEDFLTVLEDLRKNIDRR